METFEGVGQADCKSDHNLTSDLSSAQWGRPQEAMFPWVSQNHKTYQTETELSQKYSGVQNIRHYAEMVKDIFYIFLLKNSRALIFSFLCYHFKNCEKWQILVKKANFLSKWVYQKTDKILHFFIFLEEQVNVG